MNHFLVSFEGVELSDEQSARVKSAIEAAAKKEYESFAAAPDALPITYLPTGPVHHPTGGGRGEGGTGGTEGGGTGTGRGTGTPVGRHGLPIVWTVSYDPSSRSWTRA
jgi:hypothetical protein